MFVGGHFFMLVHILQQVISPTAIRGSSCMLVKLYFSGDKSLNGDIISQH